MIPFKIIFFIKKRYHRNECLDLAWDRINVRQNCTFITTKRDSDTGAFL